MLLSNPIFAREFNGSIRSWKINFLAGAYLVLLAGTLLILWPEGGIQSLVSESSRQIFSLFFNINLTLLILLTPAFSATSISYERENGTYPALFSTLLSPIEIMVFIKFSPAKTFPKSRSESETGRMKMEMTSIMPTKKKTGMSK